ncbi:MAG: ATP-binding protein, partial [Planctomycetes bacterium]|nr:ATP-binding protein [Planctomycetota bacterium]
MPTAATTTGTLEIGDQWNAITIIAHSQTHPLKAICELTENAIDAGATQVRIVRRRSKGQLLLEIEDDGRGVRPDESGAADFQRIATHLCDSMKRHLDAGERRGVHGEFGIGLLSFWSLGEELRMTSGGEGGSLRELRLVRGGRQWEIRDVRGHLPTGGTRVVVGPLLESTKNMVTGEKIARYLSAELRDRIRLTGVAIDVVDPVARRQVRVVPREFEGERLEIPRRYATPLGDVCVEIYVRGDDSADAAGISLCKDGTRVLPTVTELLPFQHAPWDDRRLVGLIDFEPLGLAPGTRSGIIPDAAFDALVAVAPEIERDIVDTLAAREQAEAEQASRQLLKQVHKAFTAALSDLPAEDYLFFDIQKQGPATPPGPGVGDADESDEDLSAGPAGPRSLFAAEPGPLATVRITPRRARRAPGHGCRLMAVAADAHGTEVVDGLAWSWRIVAGDATLEPDGPVCVVMAPAVGLVTVEAEARQGRTKAAATMDVKILERADGEGARSRGLPSYRLEAEHGHAWRSRYDARANEIVINSAHRDFLASRSSAARHRRYIGKLYAKEVVLTNFPHESPATVMERLIEVT